MPALIMAVPAQAGTLTVAEQTGGIGITYVAAPGEVNHLTLHEAPDHVDAVDVGNIITARGVNCFAYTDPGATWTGVRCLYVENGDDPVPSNTLVAVAVALGDGDDTATTFGGGNFTGGVAGGPGNDTLQGPYNLAGDKGNDLLIPETGHLVMSGGPGDDTIRMPGPIQDVNENSQANYPFGGMPAKVEGGGGHNTLSFADEIFGEGDTGLTLHMARLERRHRIHDIQGIVGTGGADKITGDRYADTIVGGPGSVIVGGLGNDDLTGQTVGGGKGNDTLHGNALNGGPGNDKLVATEIALDFDGAKSIGGLVLRGGLGNDRLSVADHVAPTTLDGGPGNDNVTGGQDGDTVIAGPGNDTYKGGANFCTFCIGLPGFASDTISYASYTHGVAVSQDGQANDGAAGEHDNVSGFERIVGTKYFDVLTGDAADETLSGLAGNDKLDGGGGNDDLDGGSGDDALDGGAGDDALDGGLGADTIGGGPGSDRVDYRLGVGGKPRTAPVNVTLDGQANDGNAGDNARQAASAAPRAAQPPAPPTPQASALRDNVASDVETIYGTDLADHLVGGSGDDTLVGGDGATVLGLGGNDTLRITDGALSPGTINGGDGNDTLEGGNGDDKLIGGAGDDQLTGLDGTDLFNCGDGNDRAADAVTGEKQFGCELHGAA